MDEGKKKAIMIAAIVVCLITAGVITVVTSSKGGGGIETIEEGETMWLKCSNPDCGAEYEISKRDYYKSIEENRRGMTMPSLVCKECGEESAYRAVKCPNSDCGVVFIYGTVRRDLPDRCPECSYSETEESRKKRRL